MQTFTLRRSSNIWDPTTDSLLGEGLLASEWVSLFEDVLECPAVQPLSDFEDRATWEQRQGERYKEALPRFPMLARIWHTYIDAYFNEKEVIPLRAECLELCATSNPLASKALNKLLTACDKAISGRVGLYLASD